MYIMAGNVEMKKYFMYNVTFWYDGICNWIGKNTETYYEVKMSWYFIMNVA